MTPSRGGSASDLASSADPRWMRADGGSGVVWVVTGGLGGIYRDMANAVVGLRTLGYPEDHPLITGQLKEIENLGVETREALHYQPCVSPVWDTSLAANALLESGLPADHPQLVRA